MTKLLIVVKIKIISQQSLHSLCSVCKFRPYLKSATVCSFTHKENWQKIYTKMACYKYVFKHVSAWDHYLPSAVKYTC